MREISNKDNGGLFVRISPTYSEYSHCCHIEQTGRVLSAKELSIQDKAMFTDRVWVEWADGAVTHVSSLGGLIPASSWELANEAKIQGW